MKTRILLLTLLLSFIAPGIAQASEVQTVLDQLVETYGGEENLRKMNSMVQEWDLVTVMGKRPGTDVRSIRAPDQLRVDLTYPHKTETRILNGNTAHAIFNGAEPQLVTGIQADAMRLQLMRLYSPLMLRNRMDAVHLTEQGGLLALSLIEHGVHVHYLINKENWHIEKVAGTLMMNGKEIQFLTEYSNFKMVEGVLIHHSENKFASGMNTARLTLRKMSFNDAMDDNRFIP